PSASTPTTPRCRCWPWARLAPAAYGLIVRDDRPFGGPDPAAARDRGGEHPKQHLVRYAGLMQAEAYAGFTQLDAANRKLGPVTETECWARGRRHFFDLAGLSSAVRGRSSQTHRCSMRRRARD